MTEQNKNWLDEEVGKLKQPIQYEELPSLKLQANVVTEFDIDFSNPFRDFMEKDEKGVVLKTTKIIPVTHNGSRMNLWLNAKNPVYREIIMEGKLGKTKFKILRTGQQKNTKYVLVK